MRKLMAAAVLLSGCVSCLFSNPSFRDITCAKPGLRFTHNNGCVREESKDLAGRRWGARFLRNSFDYDGDGYPDILLGEW